MGKIKFLNTVIVFFIAANAAAEPVLLDEYIQIKDNQSPYAGQTIATAFRQNKSCRIWNYIPGRQLAGGAVLHMGGADGIKIGEQFQVGLLNTVTMQADSNISNESLDRLKTEIVQFLKQTNSECKDPNVTEADILLTPGFVRSALISDVGEGELPFYSKVEQTYKTKDATNFDPTAPDSFTLTTDASNPQARDHLENLIENSKNRFLKIGNVGYQVDGIVGQVDSRMTLQGEFTAEWDNAIIKTDCNVTTKEKSLDVLGGAMGMAGAGLGFGSIGYKSKTTVCSYNMVEQLIGGSFKSYMKLDHSRSRLDIDGKPIMYTMCDDNNECHTIPLVNFVEIQLMTLMILQNFDVHINKVAEGIFNVKIYKKTSTKGTFDVSAEYLRNFNGSMTVAVPVYVKDLSSMDFDFSFFDSKLAKCANDNFLSQLVTFKQYSKFSPIPVADVCLKGGE